jgi:biotin transport system substrate-specific component
MRARGATITRDHGLARSALLVVAAAAITAIAAQISFGYPVPTTLQTFAVFSTAAVLGARLGVAAQLLYMAAGAVGLPVFADGKGGIDYVTTADPLHASGGYLYGFVLGALIVGAVCDRYGRSFYITVPAMLLASVAVYACGLVWLHQAIPVNWTGSGATVLHYGLWPFVLGDLAKIFAAAAVVDPAAPWGRLVDRIR